MMAECVFAGTFDPLTKGHEAIIKKAAELYGGVLVVLGENPDKKCFFSEEERLNVLSSALTEGGVEVVSYSKVPDYVSFLKNRGVKYYVRGIRDDADMKYEAAAEKVNAKLYPFLKTVYIRADDVNAEISSTAVRKAIACGKDFSSMLSERAYAAIMDLLAKRK